MINDGGAVIDFAKCNHPNKAFWLSWTFLLFALDFPFRWPFYRTLLSSATSGELGSFWPWLTTSDLLYMGILTGLTWILIFTIVPLFAYLLIAAAKSLFDLSGGWLHLLPWGLGPLWICVISLHRRCHRWSKCRLVQSHIIQIH
ncbi:MAG: hypothetical protein P8Y72_12175 [Anaerolineales bacterium]